MGHCNNPKWDISHKEHTQTKIQVLERYIDTWFAIWLAQYPKFPSWLGPKLLIVDLFAGTGKYYKNGKAVNGSPLIFLEAALNKIDKIMEHDLTVEFYFSEKDPKNFQCLRNNIDKFFASRSPDLRKRLICNLFEGDCNEIYREKILPPLQEYQKSPMFLFIDPYGIQVHHKMVADFLSLPHKKDILFNFITMGVQRVQGAVAANGHSSKIGKTLSDFLGQEKIDAKGVKEVLDQFAHTTFTDKKFKVLVYDMPYPNRRGTLYHLLLATRNKKIRDVAEKLFAPIKAKRQPSLFGPEFGKY